MKGLKEKGIERILRKTGTQTADFVCAKRPRAGWKNGSSEQILISIRGTCFLDLLIPAQLVGHFLSWVIWQWTSISSAAMAGGEESPLRDYYFSIVTPGPALLLHFR